MKNRKLNLLIGGAAGAGIEKAGHTLTLSFVRGGYYVFANTEHESRIRGGNNYLRLRVDEIPHEVHVEEADIIVALDKQTIEEHIGEVSKGGAVIFDGAGIGVERSGSKGESGAEFLKKAESRGVKLINIPLKKMAAELGDPVMANTIALGVVCGLVNFDISILKNVLAKIFAKKSAEIVAANEKAAQAGFDFVEKEREGFFVKMPVKKNAPKKMFLEGNEAFAIGAIKAGVKYVGEYPMTPSSSILHFMAKWADKYGIVVKHTEDEIAALNSAIGAGFAGARAMSATSGGGLALMSEGIGLAGMNEVPVVVVNVMRPGPATGLPTRTEQGDLRQVMHAGQGDPMKIVLLPGDIHECFKFGFEAFNLAEKYQLPVILCYDKYIGESFCTVAPFDCDGLKVDRGKLLSQKELTKVAGCDGGYKRYLRTEDGVSPRAIPGMKGGIHRATSDEHNEYGEMVEDAENRKLMVEKRAQKLEIALADCPGPELINVGEGRGRGGAMSAGGGHDRGEVGCEGGGVVNAGEGAGCEGADITFVVWGSTKSACLEAAGILAANGVRANILQIKTALPFHKKEVAEILKKCKRPIVVEHNYSAQMRGLIAENTGILIEETILRYDGRPMTAKFVVEGILNNKIS